MTNNQVIKHFPRVPLLLLLLTLSCEQRVTDVIKGSVIWNSPADLTISNMTSGESFRDDSTFTIGEKTIIVFKPGDRMQLLFTPPEKWKKYGFSVRFVLLDVDNTVSNSPYVYEMIIPDDIPTGTYIVQCTAMCDEWDEGSSCYQSSEFRIAK